MTKVFTPVLWAGIALLLGLAPAVCRANVVIGNLAAGDGSNQSIDSGNWFAASFTMGSVAYSLSDVQIRLGGNPNSTTTFTLQSDATVPAPSHPSGTDVATFTHPSFSGGTTTYTFTVSSPFTLAANTTYWLVGRTNAGATAWKRSNPQTNPSGSGATFGSYALSGNSGATWTDTTANSPIFQVDGTSTVGTPEPSSLVLVSTVACVAGAVALRRWRTRRPDAVVTAQSTAGT
jgi:hypothetical protein